ncbi:MAG: hypothetical protein ABSF22_05250 [Bryobacteraceae bacterium]
MRTLTVAAFVILLSSCESKPAEAPKPVETAKPVEALPPADESRRFPKPNLAGTIVVEKQLLGKPFMPGGTQAHYKKGKTEYDMFLAKTASANDAALMLPDWRGALTDAKLIPSFGGYFGNDAGRPVFVFAKGAWIAGVAGLNQKEADAAARKLAAALE